MNEWMNANKCTNEFNKCKKNLNKNAHHYVILCHFMTAINRDLLEQYRSHGNGY